MAFPDLNKDFKTDAELDELRELSGYDGALHQSQNIDLTQETKDGKTVQKFFDYMALHVLIPCINALNRAVLALKGNTSTSLEALEKKLTTLSGNTEISVEALEKRVESVEKVSTVSTAKVEAATDLAKAATDLAKAAAENVMQKDQSASVMNLITGQPMYFGSGSKEEIEESILAAPGETIYFHEVGLACYVVEQGTSGIWNYEKWSNGISKCWTNFQYDMEKITFLKDTNNANTYKPAYSGVITEFCSADDGISFPDGLFVDTPFVNCDAANGNGQNGLSFGQGMAKGAKDLATKEYTGTLYIDFPLGVHEDTDVWEVAVNGDQAITYAFPSGGYVPCQISLEAKGRWKKTEETIEEVGGDV